jgi:CBS domain containing-hemolysin-like protein
MRKALYVPETQNCGDLFNAMNESRTQFAVVVDEYGGTAGIVTLEDVLESIVGNIQDEYDDEEEEFRKIDENTIICKASIGIEEAFEALGMEEVAEQLEDEGYDTVGGLIINTLARIPEKGEKASVEYMFTASESGYIVHMNAEEIGSACVELGAGRLRKEDIIDPSAGIVLHKKTGDRVEKGDVVATLYCDNAEMIDKAVAKLVQSITYGAEKMSAEGVLLDIVE